MDNSFLHIRELVESPVIDKKIPSVIKPIRIEEIKEEPTNFNDRVHFYEINTCPCDYDKNEHLGDKVDLASSKYASSKDIAYNSRSDRQTNDLYNQMNQKINEIQKLISEPACIDSFGNNNIDFSRNNYKSNQIPLIKERKKLLKPYMKLDTKISVDSNSWNSMILNKENAIDTLYHDDESINKILPRTNRDSYIQNHLKVSKTPNSYRNHVRFEKPRTFVRNLSPISSNSFINFENLNPNIHSNLRRSYHAAPTHYQSRHRSKSPTHKSVLSYSNLNLTNLNTLPVFDNKPIVTNFKNIKKLANLDYDDIEKELEINECMYTISKNLWKTVKTEMGNIASIKNMGKFSHNDISSNYGLNLRNSGNLNTLRDYGTDGNSTYLKDITYNATNCTDTYNLQVASEKNKLKELYDIDLDSINPGFKNVDEFFKKR